MTPYCLAIRKQNTLDVLNEIKSKQQLYAYFEVWLDYLSDYNISSITELTTVTKENLVLVTRRDKLEKESFTLEQKIELARAVSNTKVVYDFDILAQSSDINSISKIAKKENLKINLLLSYHNYIATPSNDELDALYQKMKQSNPAIYKFAAFCNTPNDAVRLLEFGLTLKARGDQYIVLGMGEHGVVTRIFGTLWGGQMLFCPVTKEEATAPGQLSREELEVMFRVVGRERKEYSPPPGTKSH